jgi:hypothetical protein
MGKAKKLAVAALAVLALAGVPVMTGALSGGEGVHLACQGGSGSTGCYG